MTYGVIIENSLTGGWIDRLHRVCINTSVNM